MSEHVREYSADEQRAFRACGFTDGPQYAGGSYWPDELLRKAIEAERLAPLYRLAAEALRREIGRDPRCNGGAP
jgi:hypothetical protein